VLDGADRFAGSVDVGPDTRAILSGAIRCRSGRPDGRTGHVLSATALLADAGSRRDTRRERPEGVIDW